MAYEVFTAYSVTDRSKLAEDMTERIRPTFTTAGATEVEGWDVLTGPMAGSAGISSRWESLDTYASFLNDLPGMVAADDALAEMVGRSQLLIRVLFQDIASAGSQAGTYMSSARFTFAAPPVGMEHNTQLAVDAGANGSRVMTAIVGGEFSGQVVGNIYYDSLDGFPAVLAATSTDPGFAQSAIDGGAQLLSRTLFQRI